METKPTNKYLLMTALVIVLAVIGFYVLNAPDRRTGAEKIGDAISELPNGLDKASRQLEDRTPAEKLGDAVEDMGDDIKDSTNQQ